jgi:hypothetical protein
VSAGFRLTAAPSIVDAPPAVGRFPALVAALAALAAPALADPGACARTVRKESATFAKVAREAVEGCEAKVRLGLLPADTDCRTESGATVAITAAGARARGKIAGRCCGPDRLCGTGDDEALAAVGWTAATCPDIERGGCTAATADAGEVADCVTCAGTTVSARAFEFVYERFTGATPGSAVAACQEAIGKATTQFFGKKGRLLRRCWEARARGVHANPCPVPGDGKAGPAIARAAGKMRTRICAGCGGGDAACGGGDDLTPSSVGFLSACPALVPPGGTSCAAPIASLDDVADCAACISDFLVDCVDRLAVQGFAAYPAECNPPHGSCSSGVECETSLDCPGGYTCRDNGAGGTTRYCVGPTCGGDGDCGGGGVCRPYCTVAGCGPQRCQCPGFGCSGPDEVCIDNGGLACRKICTQDSDCVDPFGRVCVNPGFGFGVCIGTEPCS